MKLKRSPVTRWACISSTSLWNAPASRWMSPPPLTDHLATAHKNTDAAAALIAKTGYHRRDSDLAELQTRLAKL